MEQIRSQDSNPNRANNQEKLVDVGLTSTFNTILSQCSPQLFKVGIITVGGSLLIKGC